MICSICGSGMMDGDEHTRCPIHRKCSRSRPCTLDRQWTKDQWKELEDARVAFKAASKRPPRGVSKSAGTVPKGGSGKTGGSTLCGTPQGGSVDDV